MEDSLKKNIDLLCAGDHIDPFSFLGIHNSVLRVFFPGAKSVKLIDKDITMIRIDTRGIFEASLGAPSIGKKFKLLVENSDGSFFETYDKYSFDQVLADHDIYLFNEGTQTKAFDMMGAHLKIVDGISGVHFSVWSPNAKSVSVIGSFNNWDGRTCVMRRLVTSGIFELFVPGLMEYDKYKFEIKLDNGVILYKADPYSYFNEYRPQTASLVFDLDKYNWNDEIWLKKRRSSDSKKMPVSIYECHLQSWMKDNSNDTYMSFYDISDRLISYVKEMGYTHVEFLPVMEHPFDGSWGYQVTGYFAVTSRMGDPSDLMYLIDQLHLNDIGVILDWVPGHFPKDPHGLEKFDGTCLYEYHDPIKAEQKDWGTLVFNYERSEVKAFLISNAIFWLEKFHVDGLRVDAVASMLYLDFSKDEDEWLPNKYGGRENLEAIEFIKHMNSVISYIHPDVIMIAEESTSYPMITTPVHLGGLGFTYKWDMGWMNDLLKYIALDPVYRKFSHELITFSMMYNYSEKFILPLSHDEVVHGKRSMLNKIPGDDWKQFATLRTTMAYMYAHPGKKLLFMGNDIAQWNEWDHNKGLDWGILNSILHKQFNVFMKDLLNLYKNNKEFYELDFSPNGFKWINVSDKERSVFSFIRYGKNMKDHIIFIFNFTPVPYNDYVIGIPEDIDMRELLNSDSNIYGGSNVGNLGTAKAREIPSDGFPYSLRLNVPPLGTLILKPFYI